MSLPFFHSTHFCRTTKKRAEHAVQPVSCGDMFRKKDHCAKGKFSAMNGFSLTLQ
jgi:hypothetical protein